MVTLPGLTDPFSTENFSRSLSAFTLHRGPEINQEGLNLRMYVDERSLRESSSLSSPVEFERMFEREITPA